MCGEVPAAGGGAGRGRGADGASEGGGGQARRPRQAQGGRDIPGEHQAATKVSTQNGEFPQGEPPRRTKRD